MAAGGFGVADDDESDDDCPLEEVPGLVALAEPDEELSVSPWGGDSFWIGDATSGPEGRLSSEEDDGAVVSLPPRPRVVMFP